MTVDAKLRITPQLEAAVAGLRGLAREVRALEGGVKAADRGNSFRNTQAGIEGITGRLRAAHAQLLAFFGLQQGVQGVVAIARMSDEYQSLNARLRIVTRGQEEFNQALDTTRRLAQSYQAPLNETASLFTRMLAAVRPLGGGVKEAAVATEAMLAGLKITGATAAESASAILQFSQALGSGVLRGEEFNAINEAAPRLLDALAAGLGKPKSELKALAEQGALTTSAVIEALRKQLPALRAEAAQIPGTISGAAQQARDALAQFVGKEMQGSARTLADILKLIAENVQAIATALAVLAGAAVFTSISRLAGSFSGWVAKTLAGATATGLLVNGLRGLLALLGGPGGIIVAVLSLTAAWIGLSNAKQKAQTRTLEQIREERAAVLAEIEDLKNGKGTTPITYMNDMYKARRRLGKLDDELLAGGQKLTSENYVPRSSEAAGSSTLRDPAAIKKFQDEYKLRADIVKKFADDRATYIIAKDKDIAAAREGGDAAEAAKLSKEKSSYLQEQSRSEREALKTFDTRDAVTRLAQAKQLYDKDFELLADATKREQAVLQEQWDDGLVGLRDYLAEKGRLQDAGAAQEIQRLSAQRAEEQRALAINQKRLAAAKDPNAKDQARDAVEAGLIRVAELDAEIVKKERDRVDAQRQLAIEVRNVTREIQQQALALDAEIRSANGTDTPAAIAERIRSQLEDQRRKFVAGGGDGKLFDENTDVKIRQAQLQLVQRNLDAARTQLDQAEGAVRNEESSGAITTEEAEARILELRRQQLPALQAIALQLQQMAVSPEEKARARAVELENERLADTRATVQKTLEANARNGLGQMFADIVSGAKTAGDALRGMLASFAQQMLNLVSKRLGDRLFESFGLGRVVDAGASWITRAFGFHQGGVVGAGGASFTRSINVSPLAAALAPRYHTGGIVGLRPRERMAVLEDGEEVLTADDPRHARNLRAGGVQANTTITINGAGGDRRSQQGAADDLGRVVESAIDAWAMKQSRPGGILAGRG